MSKLEDGAVPICDEQQQESNKANEDDNSDKESFKSVSSFKSSSSDLKYQSSSAESLGRPELSPKAASSRSHSSSSSSRSRSRSQSPSRSQKSFSRYESRNPIGLNDFRRHRPFRGRRENFAGRPWPERGKPFVGKPRYMNHRRGQGRGHFNHSTSSPPPPPPPPSNDSRKRYRRDDDRRDSHSERRSRRRSRSRSRSPKYDDSAEDTRQHHHRKHQKENSHNSKVENPKVLKPSDLKDSAKQKTQSFLAMLEEKKKILPFSNNAIVTPPNEAKKISVKIHGFVNTFNSLAEKKAALDSAKNESRGTSIASTHSTKSHSTTGEQRRKPTMSLYSDEELAPPKETISSHNRQTKDSNASHNSSREDGEIRSDLDDTKSITSKKLKNKRKLEDTDSKHADKRKKQKKVKKKESKKSKSKSSKKKSRKLSSSRSVKSPESELEPSSVPATIIAANADSDSDGSVDNKKRKDKKPSKKRKDRKYDKKERRRKKNLSSKKKKKKSSGGSKKKHKSKKDKKLKGKLTKKYHGNKEKDKDGEYEMEVVLETKETPEWTSDMLCYTHSDPLIQYTVNPKLWTDYQKASSDGTLKADPTHPHSRRKGENAYSKHRSKPIIGKMKGSSKTEKLKRLLSKSEPMKLDMNYDYNYYYQYYYANGYPHLEQNDQQSAAAFCAYYQMMNSYDYSQQQLVDWAQKRGYTLLETSKYDEVNGKSEMETKSEQHSQSTDSEQPSVNDGIKTEANVAEANSDCKIEKREIEEEKPKLSRIEVVTTNTTSSSVSSDFIRFDNLSSKTIISNGGDEDHKSVPNIESPPPSPPPLRPKMSFFETTQPITLPNGVTLPTGTRQIIVHPYNRPVY